MLLILCNLLNPLSLFLVMEWQLLRLSMKCENYLMNWKKKE